MSSQNPGQEISEPTSRETLKTQILAARQEEEAGSPSQASSIIKDRHNHTSAPKQIEINPHSLLEEFVMKDAYVNNLGKEKFLYPDLIIERHILTLIAMSGGGKTTFIFFYVVPKLADMGLTVWYIDADSPASDHKIMKDTADRHSFKLVNPDVNPGTDMNGLLKAIREIADASADLTGWVFVIDTLKKVADLMSKGSVKDFYQLARKLCNLGATVILLGHANKFRDKEGNLVFEGTGDVRSDTDELIFLERKPNSGGGIDVTTISDHDKGGKVRGIFNPFSFNISESREITFYENAIPTIDFTATSTPKATDDEIIAAAKKYLILQSQPAIQKQLVQHTSDMTGANEKRVRQVIVRNSEPRDAMHRYGLPFLFNVGSRNAHYYELSK